MRPLNYQLILTNLLVFAGAHALQRKPGLDEGPKIITTSGTFIGTTNVSTNIESFKGVPYAKPPVGKLRFAPPATINLEGEHNATAFGSACPQPSPIPGIDGFNLGPPLDAETSDDCLYLNIWRPAQSERNNKTNEPLPVMVYIHGGGFIYGAGSEWDPTGFITRSTEIGKPVIFVSINYRLGSLGFISSSNVPNESLNLGLQDQRAAFRWIKENAGAFGGDPQKVTISGESAGGISVHMHFLFPDEDPAFRAGIANSGSATLLALSSCDFFDSGRYAILGNAAGCGTGEGSFECLRDLPFDEFWNASMQVDMASGPALSSWAPCKGPDGSFIDKYPASKYLSGDFLDLPIISGNNLDEGALPTAFSTNFLNLSSLPIENETAIFVGFVSAQTSNGRNLSSSVIQNITTLWPHFEPKMSNSSLYERASDFLTDLFFLAANRLFLDAAANRSLENVWGYSFQQKLPGSPDFLGVFHSSDLYYLDIGFDQVPTENLTSMYQDYYINFVNDLNPGSSWPKYNGQDRKILQLKDGNVTSIRDDLKRNRTDFLNSIDVLQEFGKLN